MFAVYSLPFLGDRDLMLKQARCLFHKLNRQDACSTNQTGKMPVPQTKQARCLFHKLNRFLVGWASRPPRLDAKTGKMPVPQTKQARCLFHKLNRQDACSTNQTGKMPVPQTKQVSCGVGVPPAHPKLINNPRCELG
jgi:hypothetical protein